MEWSVATRSHPGRKRTVNEDFFAVEEKLGLFVVADGLGGHVAGRRASELGVGVFVETVASAEPEETAPLGLLREAFARANDAIRSLAEREPALRGMGTTLAALWLRGDEALLAHAGDSRLYMYRAGAPPRADLRSLAGRRAGRARRADPRAGAGPPEPPRDHARRRRGRRGRAGRRLAAAAAGRRVRDLLRRHLGAAHGRRDPRLPAGAARRDSRRPRATSSTWPTRAAARTTRPSSWSSSRGPRAPRRPRRARRGRPGPSFPRQSHRDRACTRRVRCVA